MSPLLDQGVLALYYVVLGTLALYGMHRLLLLVLYYRHHRTPLADPAEPVEWPRVTVQLPLYNERYVACRLVEAVCRLDYPRDRLEIQVLDDSTDDTTELLAETVEQFRRLGVDVHHIHRRDRDGFKAGALAAGFEIAKGELLAVFDADFLPRSDFLRRTVPHFADPRVGMVQARWEHLNRDYSLLTRIQAMFLDAHFLIEHFARNRSGRFFNFNGTAGIWRRRAIEDAGGWQHDTLTEDLDLSYRAQLAGWRFLFLPEVAAPAELPVEVNAFLRQQNRWSKGSIQTARKLVGPVLRSKVPWTVKLEAMVHLTNNFAYPLMVLLSLLIFPAMVLRRDVDPRLLMTIDLPLFFGATVAVLTYYVVSQMVQGGRWTEQLKRLPALLGLGIGLSVNNARAVVGGLFQDGGVFERTPKYKIESGADDWRSKQYRAAKSRPLVIEGLLAFYFACCFVAAWRMGLWMSMPFLYLFLHGYTYIFLLSLDAAGLLPRDGRTSEPLPVTASDGN